ncbi:sigma 54-interacting transcriptional regulator [Tundrisphaera sp. TA3]|uniref:sigma 54-interacting transcriptional regulator n=1 Tax=Tundrisphaera sp. TA3 TaxID=3435775 RepID=UPI003EBFE625
MPPHRASGARLDALVQNACEPMFWLGPDHRILSVNRAWEELTGHAAEEVAGLECRPHGPTRPNDLAGLGGSFCPPPEAMSGHPAGSTTLILRSDGERLRRRVEFWPFHDAQGGLIGVMGMVRPADEAPHAPDSEAHKLRAELMEARDRLHRRHGVESMVGRGPAHRRLLDQVAAASATAVPVLIVGEGGTGKRLAAQTIHHRGPRRQAPLLAYDCKALPPEVLERELFGGADGEGPGLTVPDGATVLIGDILDLPRDLQARLAAGLDGRARLVATTSGDPDAALGAERLRPDLYYALTTLVLRLRPLRERVDELPLLAQHLLERANLRGERRREGFRPEALAALAAYDWPGNLRELARVIEEAHARGAGPLIGVEDIPPTIRGHRGGAYQPPPAPPPASLKDLLVQVEREAIEKALGRSRQNKSRAAKLLGVNRPFLYRRIKELGIADEPGPEEADPDETGEGPSDEA